MAATLAQYRERFSEHASIGDADITRALADTALLVSTSQFDDDTLDLAQLYFTAHCVHLDLVQTPGTAVSGVASKTVGKVSVAFKQTAANGSDDPWLSSTSYGQRFLTIRNACVVGFMIV